MENWGKEIQIVYDLFSNSLNRVVLDNNATFKHAYHFENPFHLPFMVNC